MSYSNIDEALSDLESPLLALAHKYHRIYFGNLHFGGRSDISPEDLVQEGRVGMTHSFGINSHPGYLLRSARNAIINYSKRAHNQSHYPTNGISSLDNPNELASNGNPDFTNRSLMEIVSNAASYDSYLTAGSSFKERFGVNYTTKLKADPNGAEVVNQLLHNVPSSHLTRRFFRDNELLPILRAFYGNSVAKARMVLHPDSNPHFYAKKHAKDSAPEADGWSSAAKLVNAFWSASEPIPILEERYFTFTPNGEEVLSSKNRRADLIPWRCGYAFLLNQGLGISLNGVVKRVGAFSEHSSAFHASSVFYRQCKDRKINFPKKDSIPYSWRAVCSVLSDETGIAKYLSRICLTHIHLDLVLILMN